MKIAVVGSASPCKMDAPFRDRSWLIWTCSIGNWSNRIPRWDAWFELHKPIPPGEPVPEGITDPWANKDYIAHLKKQPRVYVRGQYGLRGEVQYPEAALVERFGPFFFTSSIACMMAFAIATIEADRATRAPGFVESGPDALALHGVQMGTLSEYRTQRPGCQYFIQRARELSIEVTVPPGSRLFEPPTDAW